jgi:hypothetical protein
VVTVGRPTGGSTFWFTLAGGTRLFEMLEFADHSDLTVYCAHCLRVPEQWDNGFQPYSGKINVCLQVYNIRCHMYTVYICSKQEL